MSSKYEKSMANGLSLMKKGSFKSAKDEYRHAIEFAQILGEKFKICEAYIKYGNCLSRLGDYLACIEYFLAAEHIAEEQKFDLILIKTKNYLGNNYRIMKQYDEAVWESKFGIKLCNNKLKQKLDEQEQLKYEFQKSRLLQTLAVIEMNIEQIGSSLNHIEQALIINERVLSKSKDNEYFKIKKSSMLGIKGSILMLKNKYQVAEKIFDLSLKLAEETKNSNQILSNYFSRSILKYKMHNFDEVKRCIIEFEENSEENIIENKELKIRYSLLKSVHYLRQDQILTSIDALFEAQSELFRSQSFYEPYDLLEFYKTINLIYDNEKITTEIDNLLKKSDITKKIHIDGTYLNLELSEIPESIRNKIKNPPEDSIIKNMVEKLSKSFIGQYRYYLDNPKKFEFYFQQYRNQFYRKFRNADLSNIDDLAIARYIENVQKKYSDAVQKLFTTYEIEMKRNFLYPLKKKIQDNKVIKKKLKRISHSLGHRYPEKIVLFLVGDITDEPSIYLIERLIRYLVNGQSERFYRDWHLFINEIKPIFKNNDVKASLKSIYGFYSKEFTVGDEKKIFRNLRNDIIHKTSDYIENIDNKQYEIICDAYIGDLSVDCKIKGALWHILNLNLCSSNNECF